MKNYLAVYECIAFRQAYGPPICYIEDTPENISAFIMSKSPNKNYTLVDRNDMVKVITMGNFLDYVPNLLDLEEIQPVLISMQLGERDVPEVKYVDIEEMERMIPKL